MDIVSAFEAVGSYSAGLKTCGLQEVVHRGPARVFDREEEAMEAILTGRISKGDTVVVRYEGPKGGSGMREMLGPTSALAGAGRAAVHSMTISVEERLRGSRFFSCYI